MKWIWVLMGIFFFQGADTWAQSYGTSAGLRLGSNKNHRTIGLSVQQRVFDNITLEGIAQTDFNNNTTFHALVQKHSRIISRRFNYYYGTGVGFGWEESTHRNPETREIVTTYGNNTLNAELILGVEMTLLRTNISLDYKPNVNIVGSRTPWYSGQVGISARHVIVKSKEQKKKQRQRQRMKKRNQRGNVWENLREKVRGY
ncbi:hypothetical protein KI659_05000 [Litoribacter alkaliphilus]|uniref:Uncharacterized protein n=1 Tax=Litoribacter ruber TaxID=702568 RepID=A0AAP2G122_9BACT|nr:hypothetical protein [Litoribacter alkaliphilus]MBS9523372.1 hypothetical protein [Litoribacter alkaliphilus]